MARSTPAAVLAACMVGSGGCGAPPPADTRPAAPSSFTPNLPGRGIAVQTPPTITDRSRPFAIRYAYRDLPKDSWLVLRLESADNADSYNWHGPLMLTPVALSGSGTGVLQWDSYSVGCAPNDAPRWCATGVGRFKIIAEVTDRPFIGLGMMIQPDRPLVRRAYAESGAFELRGDKDYGIALLTLRSAARSSLSRRDFLKGETPLPGSPLFREPIALKRSWNTACADLETLPPLEGRMTVCGSHRKETDGRPRELGQVKVTGDTVHWRPGAPKPTNIQASAEAVLHKQFPKLSDAAVPPEGAWRLSGPLSAYYRADTRSWVMSFHLQTRWERGRSNQRFAQILIDAHGRPCLVEVVKRGSFTLQKGDPAIACPD